MNISCIICSDVFLPTSVIFTTQCGHLFHEACLLNWISRSPTCPQCRHKTTEKIIHRLYFNVPSTDHITEDVGTLQSRLENADFTLKQNNKEIKKLKEKYNEKKRVEVKLREMVLDMEKKEKIHESAVLALKDQISFFKNKSRENDRTKESIVALKKRIRDMEHINVILEGSNNQVREILRNETNMDSLALMVAILKKSLLEAEQKTRDAYMNYKKANNMANQYKKEAADLGVKNKQIEKELFHLRTQHEEEKTYLKNKISQITKENINMANTSLARIMLESPLNFTKKPQLTSPMDDDNLLATSTENATFKEESSSPYLAVKSNGVVGMDYQAINAKFKGPSSSKSAHSIQKKGRVTVEEFKLKLQKTGDSYYDGLGKKDENFPSAKPNNMKRQKSSSSVSTAKFRKLTPSATKKSSFSQSRSQ